MSLPAAATAAELDAFTRAADRLTLVDFWAPWCAPCRAMAPILDDLAMDYADIARVVKVDVEAAPGLAKQFSVTSLPTLILFRDGVEIHRTGAMQSRTRLAALLDDHR